MPVYCYRARDGEVVERVFPVGEAPAKILVKGLPAARDFGAERKSIPAAAAWPMECIASGVNANQAGELRDHFVKVGVPTEVSRDGNPIYRDAQHRRKALKARGFVDRSSFI
jgi:hypothetical protein